MVDKDAKRTTVDLVGYRRRYKPCMPSITKQIKQFIQNVIKAY